MRNIIILMLFGIILLGCSTKKDTIGPSESTIFRAPYENRQIIKRYPAPKALERDAPVFRKFSNFPPIKIALLVPLSGKYKKLGKSMFDATQLALFSINEPNLVLMPVDTKGTSYGAVEAVNEAVSQKAKIILGPIFSKSARAITEIANENNINIVSFSNDKTLADTGVFALGFRPEQEIRRVVEFAMGQGIEDFSTVIPNNAYGAAVAKELRETVAENDMASVLKTEIFRSSNGKPLKLNKHVFSAFSSTMNTKPPKDYNEEEKAFNFNPIRFPRAMLIPQNGVQLEEITGLLRKFNHDNKIIQLLGSAQWYTQDTLGNPSLEGAWFAGPPHERREMFENKFMEYFGYKPVKLASLAYDSIALTATITRLSGGDDFSKEALSNPRGFYGVDGIFRFQDNGLAERGLAIMTIENAEFKTISPSPRNFFETKEIPEPEEQDLEEIEDTEDTVL